jgi:hypothetical protein
VHRGGLLKPAGESKGYLTLNLFFANIGLQQNPGGAERNRGMHLLKDWPRLRPQFWF